MELKTARLAASTTLHCLTGCTIGETLGLTIGVSLSWSPISIALFATALAFVSGFALTLVPLTLQRGLKVIDALKLVWIGEVVSISAMEIAMNSVDVVLTGGAVLTLWVIPVMFTAGFFAAVPYNYWRLKALGKACH